MASTPLSHPAAQAILPEKRSSPEKTAQEPGLSKSSFGKDDRPAEERRVTRGDVQRCTEKVREFETGIGHKKRQYAVGNSTGSVVAAGTESRSNQGHAYTQRDSVSSIEAPSSPRTLRNRYQSQPHRRGIVGARHAPRSPRNNEIGSPPFLPSPRKSISPRPQFAAEDGADTTRMSGRTTSMAGAGSSGENIIHSQNSEAHSVLTSIQNTGISVACSSARAHFAHPLHLSDCAHDPTTHKAGQTELPRPHIDPIPGISGKSTAKQVGTSMENQPSFQLESCITESSIDQSVLRHSPDRSSHNSRNAGYVDTSIPVDNSIENNHLASDSQDPELLHTNASKQITSPISHQPQVSPSDHYQTGQDIEDAQQLPQSDSTDSRSHDGSMRGLLGSFKDLFNCLNGRSAESANTTSPSSDGSGLSGPSRKREGFNQVQGGRKRKQNNDGNEERESSRSSEQHGQPTMQNDFSSLPLACFFVKSHPWICRDRQYGCCDCEGYKRFPDLLQHVWRRHRGDHNLLPNKPTIDVATFELIKRTTAQYRPLEMKWKAAFQLLNREFEDSNLPSPYTVTVLDAQTIHQTRVQYFERENERLQDQLNTLRQESSSSHSSQDPEATHTTIYHPDELETLPRVRDWSDDIQGSFDPSWFLHTMPSLSTMGTTSASISSGSRTDSFLGPSVKAHLNTTSDQSSGHAADNTGTVNDEQMPFVEFLQDEFIPNAGLMNVNISPDPTEESYDPNLVKNLPGDMFDSFTCFGASDEGDVGITEVLEDGTEHITYQL